MNIKFNFLYLIWLAMLVVAAVLAFRFVTVSETTIFGAAESEGQILNTANSVVVKKILVQAGEQVHKGDTLLLLHRPELEIASAIKQNEWQQGRAQRSADNVGLERELAKLQAAHQATLTDLQGQMNLLAAESKSQSELRKIVGGGNGGGRSLIDEQILAIKKAIAIEQSQFEAQALALRQQQAALSGLNNTQMDAVQDELVFLEQDKGRLVLLSPMDGYIESIFVFENEVATDFKPLLKINPKRPNKVRGFLPESADVVYQLGDTVQLHSMTRPAVKIPGVLMSGPTSLVELPMRLRRFQSQSSWGREIYFRLPDQNVFFIGEKIVIHMPNRPKSWSFMERDEQETRRILAKEQ